jgi:hypothetical protein
MGWHVDVETGKLRPGLLAEQILFPRLLKAHGTGLEYFFCFCSVENGDGGLITQNPISQVKLFDGGTIKVG